MRNGEGILGRGSDMGTEARESKLLGEGTEGWAGEVEDVRWMGCQREWGPIPPEEPGWTGGRRASCGTPNLAGSSRVSTSYS